MVRLRFPSPDCFVESVCSKPLESHAYVHWNHRQQRLTSDGLFNHCLVKHLTIGIRAMKLASSALAFDILFFLIINHFQVLTPSKFSITISTHTPSQWPEIQTCNSFGLRMDPRVEGIEDSGDD